MDTLSIVSSLIAEAAPAKADYDALKYNISAYFSWNLNGDLAVRLSIGSDGTVEVSTQALSGTIGQMLAAADLLSRVMTLATKVAARLGAPLA